MKFQTAGPVLDVAEPTIRHRKEICHQFLKNHVHSTKSREQLGALIKIIHPGLDKIDDS